MPGWRTIRFVGPGEIFAAVAALDRTMRLPVTVAALSRVRIAFWPRPVIREIFGARPALSSNLLEQIADRAQKFQSRLREVATERVPQRLAHMLLRLARQAGRPVTASSPATRGGSARAARPTRILDLFSQHPLQAHRDDGVGAQVDLRSVAPP